MSNDTTPAPLNQAEFDQLQALYRDDQGRNIAVQPEAMTSRSDTGTWVQAWVWLPAKQPL